MLLVDMFYLLRPVGTVQLQAVSVRYVINVLPVVTTVQADIMRDT